MSTGRAGTARWALSREVVADLARRAGRALPREACGLLVETPGATIAVVELENCAVDARRAFELDPGEVVRAHLEAEARSERVVATWHSHPKGSAAPSPSDVALTHRWPHLVHVIVTPRGSVAAWDASGAIDVAPE